MPNRDLQERFIVLEVPSLIKGGFFAWKRNREIHENSRFGLTESFGATLLPASILYKSIAGRYRPVSYPDWPITFRYRFIKNAYWAPSPRLSNIYFSNISK